MTIATKESCNTRRLLSFTILVSGFHPENAASEQKRVSAMKKLWSLFLAVLLMMVLTVPAMADGGHGQHGLHGPVSWSSWWNNRCGPGNRGRGNPHDVNIRLASGIGQNGHSDPRVTVVPPGGSSQQAVTCLIPSGTAAPNGWGAPIGRTDWISLQADCTTGLAAGATYVYTTTFTVGNNRPSVSISGNVMADDSVTIQLNGNTIFTGGGLASPTSFSSNNAAFFTSGVNTLTFSVYNAGGPSGLDFVANVQTGPQSHPANRGDFDNDGD